MLVRLRQEVQALPRRLSSEGPGASRRTAGAVALVALASFVSLGIVVVLGWDPYVGEVPGPGWARAVGSLGSWEVLPLIVAAVVLAFAVAGRPRAAFLVVVALAGAGVVSYVTKLAIGLSTQDAADSNGLRGGYPSGHVAATTAVVGALIAVAWRNPRTRSLRFVVMLAGLGAVAAMASARALSSGHTLPDLLGGVALGVGWVAFCLHVWPSLAATADGPPREAPRRERLLAAVVVSATAVFVAIGALYHDEAVASRDRHVLHWIAGEVPAWAESSARAFSSLGTWSSWIVGIGLPLALLVARRFRDAAWAAVTFAGIHALTGLLKAGFDRPRPHGANVIALPGSPSFPSGHASSAVVTFGVLAMLASERWPARARLFWTIAAVLAFAIGTSRVVLGVHFATDVLAGWCLGLAWLAGALLVRDSLVSGRS